MLGSLFFCLWSRRLGRRIGRAEFTRKLVGISFSQDYNRAISSSKRCWSILVYVSWSIIWFRNGTNTRHDIRKGESSVCENLALWGKNGAAFVDFFLFHILQVLILNSELNWVPQNVFEVCLISHDSVKKRVTQLSLFHEVSVLIKHASFSHWSINFMFWLYVIIFLLFFFLKRYQYQICNR